MKVVRTKAELRAELAGLTGRRALVMTMGALHGGHLALVEAARQHADHVVVSIYVNPLQFGPGEDFAAYPRQLEADVALLADKADLVFAPSDAEMYPQAPLVRLDPGPVARVLEGATRPGHFAGVLQVVNKVMNLVRPDVAVFGQKDAQQLALIRTMVRDLDMGIEILPVPIVRDSDGVARSSRNTYLTTQERTEARTLSQALAAGRAAAGDGPAAALAAADAVLAGVVAIRRDYLVLVDPTTFQPVTANARVGLLAVAAWVGSTRLIDNMLVEFGG